jgi:hypothetical protein
VSCRTEAKMWVTSLKLLAATPLIAWYLFTQTTQQTFWLYMLAFAGAGVLFAFAGWSLGRRVAKHKEKLSSEPCPHCGRPLGESVAALKLEQGRYLPIPCLACGGAVQVPEL